MPFPPPELVAWWQTDAPTEADREASWQLSAWLQIDGGEIPRHVTPAAFLHAGEYPTATARWNHVREEHFAKSLPPVLRELPGVRQRFEAYIGEWSVTGFERIQNGLPKSESAGWIFDIVIWLASSDPPALPSFRRDLPW